MRVCACIRASAGGGRRVGAAERMRCAWVFSAGGLAGRGCVESVRAGARGLQGLRLWPRGWVPAAARESDKGPACARGVGSRLHEQRMSGQELLAVGQHGVWAPVSWACPRLFFVWVPTQRGCEARGHRLCCNCRHAGGVRGAQACTSALPPLAQTSHMHGPLLSTPGAALHTQAHPWAGTLQALGHRKQGKAVALKSNQHDDRHIVQPQYFQPSIAP